MQIESYLEHLPGAQNHKRVIVALIPDANAIAQVDHWNQTLQPFWVPKADHPIVFGRTDKRGVSSVPHMTVVQMDVEEKNVPALTENVGNAVAHWRGPAGGLGPMPIKVHFDQITTNDHESEPGLYASWDVNLATAMTNDALMRLLNLMWHGGRPGVRALRNFAAPDSQRVTQDMPLNQVLRLASVGDTHAGVLHITLGMVKRATAVNELIDTEPTRVSFGHVLLGWVGPHGTVAEVIKTWPLS